MSDQSEIPNRISPLRLLFMFIGVVGFTACLTAMFLGMRSVMEIGGACADGGPFVSRQPCPDGAPLLLVASIFGLFIFGGLYAGAASNRSKNFVLLGWPALFGSLGYNFLDYGFEREDGAGIIWGWVVCGIVFELMALPVLIYVVVDLLPNRSASSDESQSRIAPIVYASRPTTSLGTPNTSTSGATPAPAVSPYTPATPSKTPAPAAGSAESMVANLERLEALHTAGSLTDAEFAAAKAEIIRGAS